MYQSESFKENVIYKILLFSCSVMSDSLLTPWTVAHQAPLSMGFLRQEYWSGLPFPSSGDLPNPGIEPISPALAGAFFTTEPPGNPMIYEIEKCYLKYLHLGFYSSKNLFAFSYLIR